MKTIKEWMKEKGIKSVMEDSMTKSIYNKTHGGTLEVDPALRMRVDQFINRIRQMKDYSEMGHDDLAIKIHDAVDAVLAGVSGTNVSSSRAFDKLYSDDPIAKEEP
jgi:hypothetical protein